GPNWGHWRRKSAGAGCSVAPTLSSGSPNSSRGRGEAGGPTPVGEAPRASDGGARGGERRERGRHLRPRQPHAGLMDEKDEAPARREMDSVRGGLVSAWSIDIVQAMKSLEGLPLPMQMRIAAEVIIRANGEYVKRHDHRRTVWSA